ncbi:hypothetical protein JOF53_000317 [Crossiella equi]|uniref:Condensation domain-containing protein n=1 Tax=Crossiella equi TaxID=130796 RepID=A0ABS5A6V3_9PSEU|nr:condensation domain-containing protein [Crossiella equi]MBP2471445.1 hypothetical protein [Crossiella equi]
MPEQPTSLQQESRLRNLPRYGPAAPTTVCWRVRGALDPVALERALHDALARHDALRTYFPGLHPTRCTVLDPDRLGRVLHVLPGTGADPVAQVRAALTPVFDLTTGPLVRAVLLPEAPGSWLFGIAADHAVWDMLSLPTFTRDLAACYAGTADGLPAPVSYADLAARQRERFEGEWGRRCERFWFERFDRVGGYPAECPLPARGTAPSGHSDTVLTRALDGAALTGLCRAHRSSPFGVLAALVLDTALRRTGARAAGLVTDVHGRVLPGSAAAVGLFAHGAPVTLAREPGATLGESVAAVRADVLDTLDHAVPLRGLTESWRARTGNAPASTSLYFSADEDRRIGGLVLPGADVAHVPLYEGGVAQPGRAGTMLALHAATEGPAPVLEAQFAPEVFAAPDVADLLDTVVAALASARQPISVERESR